MTEDARKARRRRRQEKAIRALGRCGNPKQAALDLAIAESTLRKWVAEYVKANSYDSPAQAIYWLDRPTQPEK